MAPWFTWVLGLDCQFKFDFWCNKPYLAQRCAKIGGGLRNGMKPPEMNISVKFYIEMPKGIRDFMQ